jgi:hypothetical protein
LNFYIGVAGTTGQRNNPATEVLTVKDQSDFLEWDFEDHTEQTRFDESFWFITSSCGEARKKLEGKVMEKIEGLRWKESLKKQERSRKVKKKHKGSRSRRRSIRR